jgi:hypothetical protein
MSMIAELGRQQADNDLESDEFGVHYCSLKLRRSDCKG